jgi:outer membrane protein OmpA-like peptidoglycan-associated protein
VLQIAAEVTAQELTIYFQNDSHRIEKVYSEQLMQLVAQGIEIIQLEGFTDQNGSHAYNQLLSEKRVQAVKELLLAQGMLSTKITFEKGKWKQPETSKSYYEQRCVQLIYSLPQRREEEKPQEKQKLYDIEPISSVTLSEKVNSLEVGQKLALHNLTFIPGRRYLLAKSRSYFAELLNTLKDNPSLKIEIHGHVCCTPNSNEDGRDSDTGQKNLSVMRAKHVFDSLVRSGIQPERLSYKGFGGSTPLVDEVDERSRQMNRRVEILIVAK